jgi:hypothetical protein
MQETISAGSCVVGNSNLSVKEVSQKNYAEAVKGQEGYYKNLIISCLIFSVCAIAGYSIYQHNRIEQLTLLNTLNVSGSKLNDDNFRDVLFTMIHDLRNNNIENSKNIGKVEGILAVATNQKPDSNEYSKIWHEGYYRGMNQIEEVGASEYVRGYHAACDDLNCPEGNKEKAYNGIGKRSTNNNNGVFSLPEQK